MWCKYGWIMAFGVSATCGPHKGRQPFNSAIRIPYKVHISATSVFIIWLTLGWVMALFWFSSEQPRPVNPKAEECVSWLTRNCVTPGISPLCRVPARLIWNIFPLFAAHSICPVSFLRSSLLLFTSHHRQTPAWLCLSFTTDCKVKTAKPCRELCA